jgi:copper(I)-binding protein
MRANIPSRRERGQEVGITTNDDRWTGIRCDVRRRTSRTKSQQSIPDQTAMEIPMRNISTLMLTTSILVASAATAFAHAWLQSASPPVDSTVTQSPAELTIAFTGAIEPRFSTIEVTNDSAERMDDAQPRPAPGDGTRLSVGLRSLPPGMYTVAWHATSVDTHRTDGTYRFTVAATNASGISFEHVWARPTAGQGTTGAVYFTVVSNSDPDKLLGVSTPVAATAELHETSLDSGIMKMRPVPSIALVPGKPVTFKPGSYHVMLTGLKSPLKPGTGFPLTLTFEHAQPITVTVNVQASAAAETGHTGMEGMPSMQGH